jgi:hypothetical protein
MINYTALAINKLRPNCSWSFDNYDYSTIKWFESDSDAPTQKEIDEAIKEVKADEIAEAEAKAQAKATAEGKLAALGLTTDDLRALGL